MSEVLPEIVLQIALLLLASSLVYIGIRAWFRFWRVLGHYLPDSIAGFLATVPYSIAGFLATVFWIVVHCFWSVVNSLGPESLAEFLAQVFWLLVTLIGDDGRSGGQRGNSAGRVTERVHRSGGGDTPQFNRDAGGRGSSSGKRSTGATEPAGVPSGQPIASPINPSPDATPPSPIYGDSTKDGVAGDVPTSESQCPTSPTTRFG
jgi:hypothetical protein